MASVASEADRSLAKVFIAVLAGCLLPGGGTFWLKDIEGKKSPPGGKRRSRVGWEEEGGVEGKLLCRQTNEFFGLSLFAALFLSVATPHKRSVPPYQC